MKTNQKMIRGSNIFLMIIFLLFLLSGIIVAQEPNTNQAFTLKHQKSIITGAGQLPDDPEQMADKNLNQEDSKFPYITVMKGDVNFDGVVNELDIQLIVDIILEVYLPSPDEFWAADCNDDGVINSIDVQLAINWFLASAEIIVISPNGGETWVVGDVENITWDPSIVSSKIKLEISTNIGNSWSTIADSTENNGNYSWIPTSNYISDNCLIKISSISTSSIFDQSDAPFAINAAWIRVTSPNGGEKWKVYEPQTIQWSSLNISGNVKIEVSTDGGNKWLLIDNNRTNTGTYFWMPTPDYISDSCTIKISQVSNESVFDQSDSLFCIGMKGDVNFDAVVNELDIELIVDICLEIYLPTPCEFWAADCNDDSVINTLDVQFAINWFLANAEIILISPNGGEKWIVGDIKSIRWDPSIVSSKVKIEISTNLGNSWFAIADSTKNSGSYSWIPDSNYISDRCLIKISSISTSSIFDQSDAPFTILSKSEVTFPFPQQGWYLISLPVTPPNNSLSVLFPTAIAAYAYNPATGNYYPVTSLETKNGYWLLIPAATNVTISGIPLTNYTEHYTTGWHLIGTVLGNTNFTDPKDNPNGSVIAAYGYNPATGQYYPVYPPGTGILNEKEGYWLAVMQTCDLTIGDIMMLEASMMVTDNIELFKQQFGSQPPAPPFVADQTVAQLLPNSHKIVSHNYPNPFNPETVIEYALPKDGMTQVYIYNSLGQRIRTLLEAQQQAGIHRVIWDGKNDNGELVANGAYFYRIITPEFVETQKMLLIR